MIKMFNHAPMLLYIKQNQYNASKQFVRTHGKTSLQCTCTQTIMNYKDLQPVLISVLISTLN